MSNLNTFLNEPFNQNVGHKNFKLLSKLYFYLSFSFITLTPVLFLLEGNNEYAGINQDYLKILSRIILYFFTLDLCLQFLAATKKSKYLLSFNGIIDILAVIPSWLSIVLGLGINSSALRILRLLRIGKLFSSLPAGSFLSGFRGRLIMLTIGIVGIKLLVISFETYPQFPKFENINVILGLVTFSLAMLLGTKLSVLNGRMYAIEDSICKCVGALKIFWEKDPSLQNNLADWSKSFFETIKNPTRQKISEMRIKNNHLYKLLANQQDGPNLANFARDIAYILHRATAQSPIAYENLLRDITIVFTVVVIFVIPGFTGLVSVLVLSYVFFGMFFLVDDIDRPLDFSSDSLIQANLEPLEEFINNH